MEVKNFRQYILAIKKQLKIDREITKKDKRLGQKIGLPEYQRGFYHGHLLCLQQMYDDCKKYEWVRRKR